jgi:hypothetical protein
MLLFAVAGARLTRAQVQDDFNGTTIDASKWTVTTQNYGSNNGTIAPDGSGFLVINVHSGDSGQPRCQTFIRSITTLPASWTCYSRIQFVSNALDRGDTQVGYYFEMSDGSKAFFLFDSRMGMQIRYGNDAESHDGPSLYANNWYELKFVYDGVEIRAWYRETGRSEWLGNFALAVSFTAQPERIRIGQSGVQYPSWGSVTHTLTVDYWRLTGDTPVAQAHTEDDFSYSNLNPTLWRKNERNYTYNTGTIGPDGQGSLVASIKSDDSGAPLAQTFIETNRRLPSAAWTYYARIRFSSTALDRADTRVGFYFELSDGTKAFLVFDSRSGMNFKYGDSQVTHDGWPLYPNIWYEWKFVYDGTDLRAWGRESGTTLWFGNFPLHASFTSHPERIRIGQCDIAKPAWGNVTHTLHVDYWKLTGSQPAPEGFPADEFNVSSLNPTVWDKHEQNFGYNTGTVVPDGSNLVISIHAGDSGTPLSQTWLRSMTRLSNIPWTYTSRLKFSSTATGRGDTRVGFFFNMTGGYAIFLTLDSRDGMRIRFGSNVSGATEFDGVALTPSFWYEIKLEYDGTDVYASYREDGSLTWLGNYKLTQSVTGYPEFLYIGQYRIINPSWGNVTHTLTIDYLRSTGGAAPAAPTNLVAVPVSSTQINLAWQDNSNDEDGFRIERKTGATGSWAQITTRTANVTTYQNAGLSRGTTYCYRVRAYKGAANSSYSNEATTRTFDVPAAPSNLTARAVSSSQINLSWQDNSNNESGFKIERTTGSMVTWRQVATVAANATSYASTALLPNTTYAYRVRAYNAIGDSSYSNTARTWIVLAGAPRIQAASLSDVNANGIIERNDQLVLVLDRSVIVTTAVLQPSHFYLAVAGDSLGTTGFRVGVNPYNSRQIVLTLGQGVRLMTTGNFSTATLQTGAPSGIDFSANLPAGAIKSLDGISAVDRSMPRVDDSGMDIQLTLIGQTSAIGASGGTVAVVNSPDAAYRQHRFTVPTGALATTFSFRLRPPPENLGVTGAVQIESSNPSVTFTSTATVQVEYRDSDIDRERGQREREMRVCQLVRDATGGFSYQPVQAAQTLNTTSRQVSVGVKNLNPNGSVGLIGVFGGLPIETVDERTINIKPSPSGGITKGAGTVVLMPGPRGAYTLHRIEFPNYVLTTPTDPSRSVVTIRTATLLERNSRTGGQSFPIQSDALFTVVMTDASTRPIQFRSPVHLTVQFKDRPDPAQTDIVRFDGRVATAMDMKLVYDRLDGDPVDIVGLDASRQIDAVQGTITVRNVIGLTGRDGRGVWGTVAIPGVTPAANWPLYR